MNPKTTIGLVLALLLAVGGVWWAQSSSKPEETDEKSGPESLFELSSSDIVGFEVKAGSASTCVFVKEDNQWRMTAPISGPSQHGTVDGDVSRIIDLKYVDAFPKDDADRPTDDMSSLNNPLKIVKLTDKDEKSYVLKIGSRQKLSDKTYVQKEGDDTIYLVDNDLNRSMRRDLNDYRGKRISQFNTAEAVRVEVSGSRNYILAKQDRNWTIDSPIKARAEITPVNMLLGSVANLSVVNFVDDTPKTLRPYGLNVPRLTVAITTEKKTPKPIEPIEGPTSQPIKPEYDIESGTVRVAFGATVDDKVFAKLEDPLSTAVFQVNKSDLDKISPPLKELRDKNVANIQANRAQKINLTSGLDSVELVKEGANWKIASGIEGMSSNDAELAAVDDLLKGISDLKAIGFEDAASPNHGFESPRAVVEVSQTGQVEPVKLLIGGLTPSKTSAYIKNEREDFVALVPADKAKALTVKPIMFLNRELLKFPLASASKLEIVRSARSCTVQRENNVWQFTAPVRGNAALPAVSNIISDLSNLRGRRVVAKAAEAAQYGLDNPVVKVMVTVESDSPTVHTVLVTRRGGKVYAMTADGATICEVDAKVLTDLEAELLETKVLSLEPSQGNRLAFSGENTFAFKKTGDTWELEGEPSFQTDPTKITQVLETLRDLRALRFVSYSGADLSQYGLDMPEITITSETSEGDSSILKISSKGQDDDRYASISTADDRVFVIKPADLTKLQKKVTDFQKAN